jgi:hypothetical protein
MKNKQNKQNKKTIVSVVALIAAVVIIGGGLLAYFSDMISTDGTATSGTLDISGTYQVTVNGAVDADGVIENLNPGDIIHVGTTGNITNLGNKSAWIRDVVDFTGTDTNIDDYLYVFDATLTATDAQLLASANLTLETGYVDTVSNLTNSLAIYGPAIINGVGAGAETETSGTYDVYAGATGYTAGFTIVYIPSAPNSTQGKAVAFAAKTQALQYRNNSTTVPDEAAWSTVVAL